MTQIELTERELAWILDVAGEGVALLKGWVQEIESEGGNEDEMEDAIRYGVRADCGERVMDKLREAAER